MMLALGVLRSLSTLSVFDTSPDRGSRPRLTVKFGSLEDEESIVDIRGLAAIGIGVPQWLRSRCWSRFLYQGFRSQLLHLGLEKANLVALTGQLCCQIRDSAIQVVRVAC